MFHEYRSGELDPQALKKVRVVVAHLKGAGLNRQSCNTAFVLLAAALVGPEVLLIAQILDLEYEFVEKIGNRMTASGLWMTEDVYTEDWVYEPFFDGFFHHIAVGEGLVVAVPTADGFSYTNADRRTRFLM